MIFNEKQINHLKEIYGNDNQVFIEGVNGIGQVFETTGEIATNDLGNPAIREDGLYMEFGDHEGKYRSKFFGKFLLEFHLKRDIKETISQLIIKSMKDREGNIIFENIDFELQLDKIKESNLDFEIVDDAILPDRITEKLHELIGNPVILADDEQTLEGVSCGIIQGNGGNSTAILLSEIVCKTYDINQETKLYAKNKQNEFSLIAYNSAQTEVDENLDYLLL